MGLLNVIALDTTTHDVASVGQILADSDCDLGCDDECLDVLVAAGVRPWQFAGDWMAAKCEAHNLRTFRKMMRQYLQQASAASPALLPPFVLGGAALLGLASEASAAEHESRVVEYMARSLWVLSLLALAAVIVMIFRDKDPGDGPR